MKKLGVLVLFSALFLSGCSSAEKTAVKKNNEADEISKDENTEKEIEENQESLDQNNGMVQKEQQTEGEKATKVSSIEPLYKLNENNWSIEPIGNANKKVVLLTIDDAPDKHALEMAKTLAKLGVKAIFFVNGHFIDTPEEEKVLKEIHDLGFPIGNHTYSHSNLKDLSEETQYEEIVGLNDRIENIIGERPKFFRAPFGSNTDYSRRTASEEKMLIMNWTYGYDWEKDYQTKDAIKEIMVNSPYLIEGANLLMHDRAWTSAALEGIVEGLQQKGFEIADPYAIRTPK